MAGSDLYRTAEREIEAASAIGARTLNLAALGLVTLPESLVRLGQLQTLNLADNRLTTLPEWLGKLTQLQTLQLHNNRLTALPESLGQLKQLQTLQLYGNRLTTLPESLGRLTRLQTLELSANQLETLPKGLLQLKALLRLFLHHNPALGLPQELLGADWNAVFASRKEPADPKDILTYFFETVRAARPLNEVKMLVVGRGSAGKTSILRRLREGVFDSAQMETHGIDIQPWKLSAGGQLVTVHTWDFAGQVITHATHQFFLTTRSLYLLVLTGRENSEKTDADYWLRLVRAFGTEQGASAPVIVVLNKCKSSPCHLDRNALQEKYPFVLGFVETDCKSGTGIRALKQAVTKAIGSMDSVHRLFPGAWAGIKAELSEPTVDYISYADFRTLCEKHGERDQARQDTLSRILHELGVALNYAEDARLREHSVLNPHWVTNGIYTLLRNASHPGKPEEMTEADARRVLPREKPEMRRYLIQLMRRFELAFPLDEKGDRWLVPQRLPDSQPKLGKEWQGPEVTRVRYAYGALPEGLIPRFITRTYPLSEGQPRWGTGVVLEDKGAQALVRADLEERQITVSVIGPAQARPVLASLVCQELQGIHDDIRGLGERQEMELADQPGVWILVNSLRADEKAFKSSATDSTTGSVLVDNTKELDRISRQRARSENRPRLRAFISYSKHDYKQKDELLVRLKLLCQEGLIEPWHDRDIRPGDEWDEEIQRQLAGADLVLCLVSDRFLGTDYIKEHELPAMCARADKGECQVVPIILEKCLWERGPLAKFNALPAKGSPVRETNPHRKAWVAVQEALLKLCEEQVKNRPKPDPVALQMLAGESLR